MKILVTGATGNVGAQVVRDLRAAGVPTRAFVRDSKGAAELLGSDVELAVGDFEDRGSIRSALDGVDRVFLACGNVPGQVDFECAAIDAARAAGVQRVVKLSSPSPAVDSPLIFDRWHAEIERSLVDSKVPSVMLRPRTYLTNLLGYADAVAATGRIFAPAGDARITFVDPRDVGAAGAAAVLGEGLRAQYTLTGPEAIGFDRIAAELSAATGQDIGYIDVPDEAAHQAMLDSGLPPMVADFIVGVFRSQRAGTMSATTGDLRSLLGREPRTIAQFARDHAAAFGARQAVGTASTP